MAQFDFEKTIQCIPDFHGNVIDVQNFVDGAGEENLIKQFLAAIRLKLKDDAKDSAMDIMISWYVKCNGKRFSSW